MKLTYQARAIKGVLVPLTAFQAKALVGLSRFKPEAILRVTVESEVKRRTLSQNARYWKVIVPLFSEWAGYEQFPESAEKLGLAPKDSAHEILKAMFIGERIAVLPDGSEVKIRPSTAKLTVSEMSDLQERAERFLVSQGIQIPADES